MRTGRRVRCAVVVLLLAASAVVQSSPAAAQNPPVTVRATLSGAGGDVREGGCKEIRVTLSRRLQGTERLEVPLALGGSAGEGYKSWEAAHDYTLRSIGSTDIEEKNPDRADSKFSLIFSGGSHWMGRIEFCALWDLESGEPDETVDIGLGTLVASNLVGGVAAGTDNLATFDILNRKRYRAHISVSGPFDSHRRVHEDVDDGDPQTDDSPTALTIRVTLRHDDWQHGSGSVTSNTDGAPIRIPIRLENSSASEDDYTLSPSVITIAEGASSGTATLTIVDDDIMEGSERFKFNVGALPKGVRRPQGYSAVGFWVHPSDGADRGKLLFRVCGGSNCPLDGDTATTDWEETTTPSITLTEGGPSVSYQYKPSPTVLDQFRSIDVQPNTTSNLVTDTPPFTGPAPGTVVPSAFDLEDRDRFTCGNSSDHQDLLRGRDTITTTSRAELHQVADETGRYSCPLSGTSISWDGRDVWRTITFSAGEDSDTFDHTKTVTHGVITRFTPIRTDQGHYFQDPTGNRWPVTINIVDDDSTSIGDSVAGDQSGEDGPQQGENGGAADSVPTPAAVAGGSFESPTVTAHGGTWHQFADGTAGLGWSVSGGPLELMRGILGGASHGAQHAELDGTGSVTISQVLATEAGGVYEVSFDYKARPGTAAHTNGLSASWNGTEIAAGITLGSTWQTHTAQVTGTGSDTLAFSDTGTSDGAGTFLDNVSVTPVAPQPQQSQAPAPEPEQSQTPVVSISGGSGVSEGGTATFTVTATPAPPSPVTVKVGVSESGSFGASGAATVTVSGATATYTVSTSDDQVDEADGTVTATLQDGSGYTVSATAGSASVDVADDDDPPPPVVPVVSISGGSGVTEGGTASFTITASPAPSSPITVKVGVSESGSFGASGAATVTVSGATATYTVTTADDLVDETDGSVTVTLEDGSGYMVSATAGSASVGVSDDDDPPPPVVTPVVPSGGPVLSVGDATAVEGGSLPVMEFTVRLSEPAGGTVRVHFSTRPVTAAAGSDYIAGTYDLVFGPGVTERQAYIWVWDDRVPEGAETFEAVLSDARGASIGDGVAVGTITDND